MSNQELTAYNNERKVVQVGYASSDVRRTMQTMYDLLGMGPWEICTLTSENSRHVKMYGKRLTESFYVYVAHCMVGKTDFEVLQPLYGSNAYSDFINKKGEGFQHPKEKYEKADLWDVTLDSEEAGAKLMLTGAIDADRFVYLDMQENGAGVYELGNQPDLDLAIEKWPSGDVNALRSANQHREITQIGYITRDLERVMRTLYRTLKMGPWTVATLDQNNTQDFAVNGKKIQGSFSCRVAICMRGNMQMEICQPIYGLTPLDDYLEKHGEGMHHVREKLSEEGMNAFLRHMQEKGIVPSFSGMVTNEKIYGFNLEKQGISVYEISGPTGQLSLDGLKVETWPKEN